MRAYTHLSTLRERPPPQGVGKLLLRQEELDSNKNFTQMHRWLASAFHPPSPPPPTLRVCSPLMVRVFLARNRSGPSILP